MSAKKPIPKETLKGEVKQVHRVGFVGIDDRKGRAIEDIVQEDISKIAHKDKHTKDAIARIPQQTNVPKEDKSIKQNPKPAPHISERPYTQYALVQSVYYPDDKKEKPKGPSKTVQNFKQNRSLENLPKNKICVEDYEKYYGSERKVHLHYGYENQRPRQVDPHRQKPIKKQELYRIYAQKHRSTTVPEINEYNQDLIYPPTNKAPDRVIFNTVQKQPPLTNISNNKDPIMDYRKILQFEKRGQTHQRGYDRDPMKGYAPCFKSGGFSSYLEPRTTYGYLESQTPLSYLRGGRHDPYRSFARYFY